MSGLSRRGFIASGAGLSVALIGSAGWTTAQAGTAQPLLLYDAGLAGARRFAARAALLGHRAIELDGDRVRQVRALLEGSPRAIFAMTRHADELLVGEIAAEAGYRRLAVLRQRGNAIATLSCRREGAAIGTLARLAGGHWPDVFAELALGGSGQCSKRTVDAAAEPALSWVMVRRT